MCVGRALVAEADCVARVGWLWSRMWYICFRYMPCARDVNLLDGVEMVILGGVVWVGMRDGVADMQMLFVTNKYNDG